MTASRFLLPAVAALALCGMARKPTLTVRFYVESKANDGASFTIPVKLTNPPRQSFMSNVPDISERNIVGVYPVQSPTGTWGCAFKLDEDGRLKLETLSRNERGLALIMFVQTKGGTHQVIDMTIDRPVGDGILYVPRGLTAMEVVAMLKEYKPFGPAAATPAPEQKVKKHWWS